MTIKTIKITFLLTAFLALGFGSSFAQGHSGNQTVNIWHKLSLTFDGPQTNELATPNPFSDFRADAIFISPSNKRYLVPGFYAADANAQNTHAQAGNKWQVLFSPNEVGVWRYSMSFVTGENIASLPFTTKQTAHSDSAGYFDKKQGQFTVVNSTIKLDNKDFRTKGKLEYVNKPFLQFSGNLEFFLKAGANSPEVLLGFTGFDNTPTDRNYQEHVKHWQSGDPIWNTTNSTAKGTKTESSKGIIGLINFLSSFDINAFYFLTMNHLGDGKQVWPWVDKSEPTRYDVSKLAQWDILFSHMQSKGIMTHFVLTETENESLFEWFESRLENDFAISRKIYYRELFARFGYHLATTWNIGEENGWQDPSGDDKQQKANTTKQRKQFADYLQSLTYYREHIVIHNGPSLDYHIYDKQDDNILGYKSYTGPSLQGELKTNTTYNDVLKYRQLTQNSDHPWVISMDEAYINHPANDIDQWRKDNVWATFMAGGAGIEFYLGGGGDIFVQDVAPFKDFYLQMTNAAAFFREFVPFEDLTPSTTLSRSGWGLTDNKSYYLLYFKQANQASAALPQGCYQLDWFNPRSNQYIAGSQICRDSSAESALPAPPDTQNDDWVYIIKTNLK
ncbi:DUF5060 domain-containing protein [Psychrosphaera sp. B3R10]|nr:MULTISPECIES: DUF5060 domain-containing protein [unclassified Psychrosphaera]MBU2881539.1 DUF5060 domain-containing protein [Psychrosphaera sp. I2R16]MBU2991206.1 DUF5060 domain-containing protein [Psychrosphaera sp. B3R10]MDO6719463.1 DUF5060 domain-containing protein [Psychrosphaera sp. 1_MG-2023]